MEPREDKVMANSIFKPNPKRWFLVILALALASCAKNNQPSANGSSQVSNPQPSTRSLTIEERLSELEQDPNLCQGETLNKLIELFQNVEDQHIQIQIGRAHV